MRECSFRFVFCNVARIDKTIESKKTNFLFTIDSSVKTFLGFIISHSPAYVLETWPLQRLCSIPYTSKKCIALLQNCLDCIKFVFQSLQETFCGSPAG